MCIQEHRLLLQLKQQGLVEHQYFIRTVKFLCLEYLSVVHAQDKEKTWVLCCQEHCLQTLKFYILVVVQTIPSLVAQTKMNAYTASESTEERVLHLSRCCTRLRQSKSRCPTVPSQRGPLPATQK